jgi:hypothetical protein
MNPKVVVIIIIVVALVAGAVLVSHRYLQPTSVPSPELVSTPEVSQTPPVIPTTPVVSFPIVAEPSSFTPVMTPVDAQASPEVSQTASAIPTTPVASSSTVSGPPSFTLLVTPVEARARPGETILYTMSIEPKGGFDQPVSLRLDVSALFLYRNTFDLGSVSPPYPRTFEYLFRVPDQVPGGVTVKGVLIAEGGGHKEEQDLVLLVG